MFGYWRSKRRIVPAGEFPLRPAGRFQSWVWPAARQATIIQWGHTSADTVVTPLFLRAEDRSQEVRYQAFVERHLCGSHSDVAGPVAR